MPIDPKDAKCCDFQFAPFRDGAHVAFAEAPSMRVCKGGATVGGGGTQRTACSEESQQALKVVFVESRNEHEMSRLRGSRFILFVQQTANPNDLVWSLFSLG